VTLGDEHLPVYDVVMRHERRVPVSAAAAWSALERPGRSCGRSAGSSGAPCSGPWRASRRGRGY